MKRIKMSFGGDFISESDEPLQRAEDGETYVGINVFRTEKDKEGAKEEKYAYGLFQRYSNISIDVLTGYEYRFVATILIENADKLYDHGKNSFEAPFRTQSGDFAKGNIGNFHPTYSLDTDSQLSFVGLRSGNAYVYSGSGASIKPGEFRYPRVKRFYGECKNFDPSLSSDIEIPMEYKSFGLKFILESIPEGTSVSVMDNSSRGNKVPGEDYEYFLQFPENFRMSKPSEEEMSSEEETSWECIYSLNDLSKNTEEFKLKFTWNKTNGEEKSFSYTLNAEAKKKKVLKINIDGDVSQSKSGNLTCTQVDDNLEEAIDEINKTFYK